MIDSKARECFRRVSVSVSAAWAYVALKVIANSSNIVKLAATLMVLVLMVFRPAPGFHVKSAASRPCPTEPALTRKEQLAISKLF
jgi:hypothetical protein